MSTPEEISIIEQKRRIKERIKCKRSAAYWAKTYAYIKHPIDGLIKFNPYKYQTELINDLQHNRFTVVLKSRQVGASTVIAIYCAWLCAFHGYTESEIVSNRQKSAIGLVAKVSICINEVNYRWPWLIPKRTSWNKKSVTLANHSSCQGEATSDDAGRSESLTFLVLDEAAFIGNADAVWTAAKLTLSTGGGCIMVSTPNGVGNLFHEIWVNAEKGLNNFKPIKIHWTQCPAYTKDLTFDKDGKPTSSWYRDQCKDLNHDPRKIAQELDLDFLGSGDMVIRNDYLKRHYPRLQNGITSSIFDQLIINKEIEPYCRGKCLIFKEPIANHDYVLGADVARGDSNDFSGFHILDLTSIPEKKEQVFEYCGKLSPDDFAKVINVIAEWYNNAYTIVECNSFGLVTTLKLEEMKHENLYYTDRSKKIPGRKVRHEPESIIKERLPGFETTAGNKHLIVAQVEEEIRNETVVIYSHRLYNEFTTYVWKPNGRAEAEGKYNDDLVVSLAILLFVLATSWKTAMKHRARNEEALKAWANIKGEKGLPIANIPDSGPEKPLIVTTSTGDLEDVSWLLK